MIFRSITVLISPSDMFYLWVAGLEKNETQSVWSSFASVVGSVYKKKGVFVYVHARGREGWTI